MLNQACPGPATGWDLADLSPLTQPRRTDADGVPRPALTPELMQLSAELAYAAYEMDFAPWFRAGWRDITAQVNGDLTGGLVPEDEAPAGGPLQSLGRWFNNLKQRRLKHKLQAEPRVMQMIGAVRQLKTSSTGKAVVMLHPLEDGRFVVAIGFTGTGRQLYEWFSNLRMTAENGFHRGFLQLTRQFENNESAITFPEAAAALGLGRLTLTDILLECTRPDSRFLLWMAGHSQGAAIMQVWTHRKLKDMGVLPQNMLGCGFASPTVANGLLTAVPGAYPLYHVVNADDAIWRMGSLVHLGRLMVFPTDEAFRASVYCLPSGGEDARSLALARAMLARLRNTPACLVTLTALLRMLHGRPVHEAAEMLGMMEDHGLMRRLVSAADPRVHHMLDRALEGCKEAYTSLTGQRMPWRMVKREMALLKEAAAQVGMKQLLQAVSLLTGCAHGMAGVESAPYSCIAQQGADRLLPAVWQAGAIPLLQYDHGYQSVVALRNHTRPRRKARVPHRMIQR